MLGFRTLGEAPLGADVAPSSVSGTLAWSDSADTWASAGFSGAGAIHWSDAQDTWSASGAGSAVLGTIAFSDAADTWSMAGDATSGPSTDVLIVKISPFFVTDTIVTPGYQLYRYIAGVQTADGPHTTTGIDAIPDVPNQFSVGLTSDQMTLDDDGGYRGIIVWDSGGGTPVDPVADEVYVHAAVVESTGGSGDCPTTAEIADAVWDEQIADHQSAGSTGQALNDAGATGNPWNAIIEGSYTAQDLLRVLAGVAAGKTNIVKLSNGAMVTFRDITDNTNIVEAQMHKSNRVTVTITL